MCFSRSYRITTLILELHFCRSSIGKKTYSVSTFLLAKGGENNKYFLGILDGLKSGKWKPVSQLPLLPNMNKEDLAELDYFMEEKYTVGPHNQQGFQGRGSSRKKQVAAMITI